MNSPLIFPVNLRADDSLTKVLCKGHPSERILIDRTEFNRRKNKIFSPPSIHIEGGREFPQWYRHGNMSGNSAISIYNEFSCIIRLETEFLSVAKEERGVIYVYPTIAVITTPRMPSFLDTIVEELRGQGYHSYTQENTN